MMDSFTSVIVTYNSLGEIGDLLNDLATHVPASPVVVIDNASRDGCADLVSSQFSYVHLVRNKQNLGYAQAVNQGASMCNTPYILLLNPDIRILKGAVFAEMLAFMENQYTVAAAAPLQFKESAQECCLNFTWSYLSSQAFEFFWKQRFHCFPQQTTPIKVPFLNAGCLMLRRAAFERVGKLNEKYFLYGEEPDLFLKFIRYKYECYLLPNVSIVHYRERSIGKVETQERLLIRLLAVHNIVHALINGWGRICLDYLTRQIPPERSQPPPKQN